eukprot:GSChrysophyteH2.ASY1.ANO1.1050.1 assembled CDS
MEVVESPAAVEEERVEEGVLIGADTISRPGQKYPTPSPGNGDYVFYETLLKQKPGSHIAQEWCVYHGILDEERATALYAVILKRKGLTASSSVSSSTCMCASVCVYLCISLCVCVSLSVSHTH